MQAIYLTTYSPRNEKLGGGAGIDSRILTALNRPGLVIDVFPVCEDVEGGIPLQLTTPQRVKVLLHQILCGHPYQSSKFRAFREAWMRRSEELKSATRGKTVIASQWPALLLALSAGVEVDCYVAHNREYEIAREHSPKILRLIGDPKRLEKFEIEAIRRPKKVVALSALDAGELEDRACREVRTIPTPLLPQPVKKNRDVATPTLGFIGKESWPPNRSSLEVLVRDVLPRAAAQGPISLHIAGTGTERWAGAPHVAATGPVENASDFWNNIDLLVLPRFGNSTGVSVKALEASEWMIPSLVSDSVAAAVPGAPWRTSSDWKQMADDVWPAIAAMKADQDRLSRWTNDCSPQRVAAKLRKIILGDERSEESVL